MIKVVKAASIFSIDIVAGSDMYPKKKIIVIEDNDFYRSALKNLIDAQEDLEVVAEAADGAEALSILKRLSADLVLLDLRLPKSSGFDILREIAGDPALRVLVLTALESEESIHAALEAGADGYCFKDVGTAELLSAVAAVLSGRRYISREATEDPGERRGEPRLGCDCAVVWAYFNKSDFSAGRLIDCSRNGCLFETPVAVLPGSTVLIRLESLPALHPPQKECLRSSAMAEVKWCVRRGGSYVAGARYHHPV